MKENFMHATSMDLVWIVVSDFKKALDFYTKVVGLEVMEVNESFGWAELEGKEGGARLGICKMQDNGEFKPGQNACMTFTVEDIEVAITNFKKCGANLSGEIQEVPGHVKMQMVIDNDGNQFQLVQVLHAK